MGTLLFSTVAGGAGAKLSGGNFWEGVATGLSVGLLNHLAHKIIKKVTLRSMLVDGGVSNPDAAAPIDKESVDTVTDVLSELYNEAKKPDIEIVEEIGNNPRILGQVEADFDRYSGNLLTTPSIKIAHKAFSSWMQLASTIGHELVHVIDYYGNFGIWYRRNNYDFKKAIAITEINAHRWQIKMSAPVNLERYHSFYDEIPAVRPRVLN